MIARLGRRKKGSGAKGPRGAKAASRAATRERVLVARASIPAKPGPIWVLVTEAGLREIRLSGEHKPTGKELRARGWRLVRRPRWIAPVRKAIERYLEGREQRLDLPLDLAFGTPFQRRVWEAARGIPYGQVVSYADLAKRSRLANASRAVGNALGANPVPIVVPCHRIIHADQSIGGFSSGLTWKRFLLELERGQLEFTSKPRRRFFFAG